MPHLFQKRGFTLVELLVVIGVIAVLIGLLLPTLINARDSAKRVDCEAHLHQLTQAAVIYLNQHHEYPAGPLLPALGGIMPSAMTIDLLDTFGEVLRWTPQHVTPAMTIHDLPPVVVCPFRKEIAFLETCDTTNYGVPMWLAGYSYTARLNEGGTNVTGVAIQPYAGAQRRGGRRGVIWCDHTAFLQAGGVDQGYGNFHIRGVIALNPTSGAIRNTSVILGQHRAFDDGSVEWRNVSDLKLDSTHLADNCPYRLGPPGGAITFWFWF